MTKTIVRSFEASSFVPPSLQINGRGKHGKLIVEIADERSLRCAIAGICPSVRLGGRSLRKPQHWLLVGDSMDVSGHSH